MYGICTGYVWDFYGDAMGLRDEQTRRLGDGENGTRMKQIRLVGARVMTDFYTKIHRGFLKWILLRKSYIESEVADVVLF